MTSIREWLASQGVYMDGRGCAEALDSSWDIRNPNERHSESGNCCGAGQRSPSHLVVISN